MTPGLPEYQLPFPPAPPIKHHGNLYSHGHPHPNGRSTIRSRHLSYIHSLAFVLLQRHPTLPLEGDAREKNAIRIGRCIRLLWSVKEWREGELWELGLAWSGLHPGRTAEQEEEAEAAAASSSNDPEQAEAKAGDTDEAGSSSSSSSSSSSGGATKRRRKRLASDDGDQNQTPSSPSTQSGTSSSAMGKDEDRRRSALVSSSHAGSLSSSSSGSDDDVEQQHNEKESRKATERRMAFLRSVSFRRPGLRPLMLAHRAQEMIALGRWREALDEIELVIQAAPYRYEPQLNLYAGLLVVLNSSESHTTAMAASASSRNIRRRQSDSPS